MTDEELRHMQLYYTVGLSDSLEKFVLSVDSRMILHRSANGVGSFYFPEHWMEIS